MFSNKLHIPYKFFLTGLIIAVIGCSPKIEPEEIVAQVGNTVLTRQELAQKLNWEGIRPDQESEFVRQWVDRELMYQEAKRLELQKDDILKYEMEMVEKEFLVNKLLKQNFTEKIHITDAQVAAYYEKHKDTFQIEKDQIRAYHILTDTRARADLARRELMASSDFESIAKKHSIGMFKEEGGLIGFFSENDVIPEVWNVASRARIDEISRVFTSPHGFHILKVIEIRKQDDLRPLDEVKNEIKLRLKASKEKKAYYDLLVKLRNRQMVYINVPTKANVNVQ